MKLTIISPLYNDSACIPIYLGRLRVAMKRLEKYCDWQLLFVNDASRDHSYDVALAEMQRDPRIRLISFSRNFGYQSAVLAGLTEVESDIYTIIDVDCEDPPELLETFFKKIREGYQLVYGIRSQRLEPSLIVWLRKQFYNLNKLLADSNVLMWMSEFSMFTREVRESVLKPRTTFPFLRTELAYAGFKRIGMNYIRQKRVAGASHFNILGMTKFAVAGILAGTTFPLRAIFYLSIAFGVLFFGGSFAFHGIIEVGAFAALLSFVYMISTIPFLGLYLARTYKNVVNRPNYIIDPVRSFLGPDARKRSKLYFQQISKSPDFRKVQAS